MKNITVQARDEKEVSLTSMGMNEGTAKNHMAARGLSGFFDKDKCKGIPYHVKLSHLEASPFFVDGKAMYTGLSFTVHDKYEDRVCYTAKEFFETFTSLIAGAKDNYSTIMSVWGLKCVMIVSVPDV